MNMLLHNLKVALRNILKYKVQTLGSILSLAIGMVTLATVHSFLQNFRMASINLIMTGFITSDSIPFKNVNRKIQFVSMVIS